MHIARSSVALVVALSAALIPTPALAQGGGGGGSGPITLAECDYSHDGWIGDDAYLSTSPVKNAGCVSTVVTSSAISLHSVTPAPGWTYTVASGGGTNSRVEVKFENPTTGERAEFRMEFGKTVIR